MKSKIKQIEFMDKIMLPIYNIKSLVDYDKSISLVELNKTNNLLINLNNILPNFKKTFPVKDFNLHKTNNKIESVTQSLSVLKKALFIASVPHECITKHGVTYLRLLSQNNILYNYINKMSEIRDNNIVKSNDTFIPIMPNTFMPILPMPAMLRPTISYDDLVANIKKEKSYQITLPVAVDDFYKFKIHIGDHNLPFLRKNIRSLKFNIRSKKNTNGTDLIDQKDLVKLFEETDVLFEFNGNIGFMRKFATNTNILDDIILPIEYATYTSFTIILDKIQSLNILKNIIDIEIDITTIEFNKEFSNKIKFSHIQYFLKNTTQIQNLKCNLARFNLRDCGIYFDNLQVGESDIVQNNVIQNNAIEKKVVKEAEDFKKMGFNYELDGYKVFEITNHTDPYGTIEGNMNKAIIAIASGYDMGCSLETKKLDFYYYYEENNYYTTTHNLSRSYDLLSQFSYKTHAIINELRAFINDTELAVELIKDGGQTIINFTELNNEQYINVVSMPYITPKIKFMVKTNEIDKFVNSMCWNHYGYVLQNNLRRISSLIRQDIISLDNLKNPSSEIKQDIISLDSLKNPLFEIKPDIISLNGLKL